MMTETNISTPARELNLLRAILQEWQKVDPEFPLHYALCLTLIAADEGMSITTLAQRAGLSLSTVSRIVGALSDNRQSGAAYNLVSVKISVQERRRKEIFLTARGRAVMAGVAALLS